MIPFQDYSSLFGHPALVAGFSFRNERGDTSQDRVHLARALGLDPSRLVIPQQIHSANVVWVKDPGTVPNTDGILTEEAQVILSIQVADCIPVFIFDPHGRLGLVHAGWRGLVANILPNAVKHLKERGSRPEDLVILLGPAICKDHFEIGPEIREKFDPRFVITSGTRLRVDLKGIARNQLENQGVPSDQILTDSGCTWEDTDRYYSFRREGQKAGRMIAIMGWRHS